MSNKNIAKENLEIQKLISFWNKNIKPYFDYYDEFYKRNTSEEKKQHQVLKKNLRQFFKNKLCQQVFVKRINSKNGIIIEPNNEFGGHVVCMDPHTAANVKLFLGRL